MTAERKVLPFVCVHASSLQPNAAHTIDKLLCKVDLFVCTKDAMLVFITRDINNQWPIASWDSSDRREDTAAVREHLL